MQSYLTLIILLPLLGGTVNALVGRLLSRRLAEWLACGVVWGSFLCTLPLFLGYREPTRVVLATWLADFDLQAPFAFYLDPLSLVMTLMITFVCGLIHVYAVSYLRDDPASARFFALPNPSL